MKIKNLIFLVPLFLVGCNDPIEGTIQVNSNLTLNDKHHRAFDLRPGQHTMEMRVNEFFDKTEVKMKLTDCAGSERKIRLFLPQSVLLPNVTGSFVAQADQIGQHFDLAGTIQKTESDSEPVTYQEYCGWNDWYYLGTRTVTFHTHSELRTFSVDFKTPHQDDTLANFKGSMPAGTHTVIDSISHCVIP
jgi:hypothetical protein